MDNNTMHSTFYETQDIIFDLCVFDLAPEWYKVPIP